MNEPTVTVPLTQSQLHALLTLVASQSLSSLLPWQLMLAYGNRGSIDEEDLPVEHVESDELLTAYINLAIAADRCDVAEGRPRRSRC
jgi:hypothetical protein